MLIMTFLKYFFWTMCVLCFMFAFRFGARDERQGMAVISIGSIATAVVAVLANYKFRNATPWFLSVDLCVLIGLVWLMFNSRKYWPIWAGSLQLITVIIHILSLVAPKILPLAYVTLQGFWVYPMFFAIMAGTYGNHVIERRAKAETKTA
jgi:uncharacterized membrane protein